MTINALISVGEFWQVKNRQRLIVSVSFTTYDTVVTTKILAKFKIKNCVIRFAIISSTLLIIHAFFNSFMTEAVII